MSLNNFNTEEQTSATGKKACPVKRLTRCVSRLPEAVGCESPASNSQRVLLHPVRRLEASEKAPRIAECEPAKQAASTISENFAAPVLKSICRKAQEPEVSANVMTRTDLCIRDIAFVEREYTAAWQKGEETVLFDATLSIEKKIRYVEEIFDQHGNVVDVCTEVMFQVALDVADFTYSGQVTLEELKKGSFFNRLSEGEVCLERSKDVQKFFQLYITQKIRSKTYKMEIIYTKPGWKKLPNQDKLFYVLPSGIVGNPHAKVFSKQDRRFGIPDKTYHGGPLAKAFLSMRAILPNKGNIIVFFQYYLILALLRGFLRSLGLCPKFLLAVIGETNSKKTSLASLFFKLYEREEGVDINFRATKVAIEEALSENADAITIIDDIVPPETRTEDREQRIKLEILIRSFGDNQPRKRSKAYVAANPDVSEYVPVLTSAVITGESFPVALASSRSRILKVELSRKDCDLTELTRQQQMPEMLPAFAVSFIDFVTQKQDVLASQIKRSFGENRFTNPLGLKTPRYTEAFALFKAISGVFAAFLRATGEFAAEEVANLIHCDINAIAQIMLENDAEATIRPDEVLVAEAIQTALLSQNFQDKATDPFTSILDRGKFLLIHPEHLRGLVSAYYGKIGRTFPWSSVTEFSKFLDAKGLLKTSVESGKTHRTVKTSIDGVVQGKRFYHVKKAKIEQLAELGAL